MRGIIKGNVPNELTQYRRQGGTEYDGPHFTPAKEAIRAALLTEQGFLCAYCMQRISAQTMKVEHWHCQDRYKEQQLEYGNMLGCCKGSESDPPKRQHCDTRKGNQDISYNPADPNHHARLRICYLGNGEIRSDEGDFNRQIGGRINGQINTTSVLNLNEERLQNNRKEVVKAVQQRLGAVSETECSSGVIRRIIGKWEKRDSNGQLPEYCDVALYILRKHHRFPG